MPVVPADPSDPSLFVFRGCRSGKRFDPSLSRQATSSGPTMINQRQVSLVRERHLGAARLHTLPTILQRVTCGDYLEAELFIFSFFFLPGCFFPGEWLKGRVRKCRNVSPPTRCHFKSSRQSGVILHFINIKTTFFHLLHIIK